jgi:hypothetical protein
MEVSQHSTHHLDHLPLRAAAYGTSQRQHERVHDRDSQPCEISIRKVLGEMMKKPCAPPPVRIERCLAQSPMTLKKREIFLEKPWERFWVGHHDASFSARRGRSRGYNRPSLCGVEDADRSI